MRKPRLHNQFGAFCFQAGQHAKALHHFTQAAELLPAGVAFSNLFFNLGNCYAEMKDTAKSMECYQRVIATSPYARTPVPEDIDSSMDAQSALVEALNNLAVHQMSENRLQEAKDGCLRALQINPMSTEANINLGNVLRQMGQREEAVQHVWRRISEDCARDGVDFDWPQAIDCKLASTSQQSQDLHVVCVKWGVKYDSEYVNKLYRGVRRHLTSVQYDFICFTEKPEGLDPEIVVQPLAENWTSWWGKATLFSDLGLTGRFLYIDLDTVITGDLSDLANYRGAFLLMGTSDIFCETAKDGFNSSIISWPDSFGREIYDRLKRYYKYVLKYICRFDHWLEMNVSNPDLVQAAFPSQFLDYTTYCRDAIPPNCRMVCFPREPKPHTCDAPWITQLWQ